MTVRSLLGFTFGVGFGPGVGFVVVVVWFFVGAT
jgi:hypothetical protein